MIPTGRTISNGRLEFVVNSIGRGGPKGPSSDSYIHLLCIQEKLNGTESQRTPDQVNCDRAIRFTQVFSGSVLSWVLLEIFLNVCFWPRLVK